MTPLAEVRAGGVARAALALGVEVDQRRGLRPCPACGADRRGSEDKRAAAVLTSDGLGFACYRCQAKGDAVTLASLRITGARLERGDPRIKAVIEGCIAAGLCASNDGSKTTLSARPLPAPLPLPIVEPPARNEVLDAWNACRPVDEDAEACAWLKSRALPADDVGLYDLARALPVDATLPAWAAFRGTPWNTAPQAFRLLVPLFDSTGNLASLHARAFKPQDANGRDKAASPAGHRLRGLVMANPLAQLLLSSKPLGNGQSAAELVQRVGLVVAEGVPDFLSWATNYSDADADAPAVIGAIAGSWPADMADLADKVPDGCTVTLATHADEAGDRYAVAITQSLERARSDRGVQLRRWAPEGV